MSKIDPLETGWFEARYTSAPLAFVQAAATRDSIDIVESDATDPVASPHIVKLSTDGLSKALEQLKKACDPRKSLGVRATPAVKSIAKLGGQ